MNGTLQTYLVAIAIIFAMLATWVMVQFLARRFAARHPELGAAREEGGGCGTSCGCSAWQQKKCMKMESSSCEQMEEPK